MNKSMWGNRFHCCATCKNYAVERNVQGIAYKCSRLGFDTQPTYQFSCWDPKEHVQKMMEKERKNDNTRLD